MLKANTASSTATSIGPKTRAMFCDICCSATPLASRRGGTSSPNQACRAGPISANPKPISNVERNSIQTVITPVMIRNPVTMISSVGKICPASTSGFLA